MRILQMMMVMVFLKFWNKDCGKKKNVLEQFRRARWLRLQDVTMRDGGSSRPRGKSNIRIQDADEARILRSPIRREKYEMKRTEKEKQKQKLKEKVPATNKFDRKRKKLIEESSKRLDEKY